MHLCDSQGWEGLVNAASFICIKNKQGKNALWYYILLSCFLRLGPTEWWCCTSKNLHDFKKNLGSGPVIWWNGHNNPAIIAWWSHDVILHDYMCHCLERSQLAAQHCMIIVWCRLIFALCRQIMTDTRNRRCRCCMLIALPYIDHDYGQVLLPACIAPNGLKHQICLITLLHCRWTKLKTLIFLKDKLNIIASQLALEI